MAPALVHFGAAFRGTGSVQMEVRTVEDSWRQRTAVRGFGAETGKEPVEELARTMTPAVEESRTHSDSGGARERTMTPAVEELARVDLMAGEQSWRGGGLEEERVGAVEAWRRRVREL